MGRYGCIFADLASGILGAFIGTRGLMPDIAPGARCGMTYVLAYLLQRQRLFFLLCQGCHCRDEKQYGGECYGKKQFSSWSWYSRKGVNSIEKRVKSIHEVYFTRDWAFHRTYRRDSGARPNAYCAYCNDHRCK